MKKLKGAAFIFGVLAMSFLAASLIFAWTEPTHHPPGGNVPVALNVGEIGQAKSGGLILNTGNADIGLVSSPVFDIHGNLTNATFIDKLGNIGINTISPGYRLDVSGTGRFTGALTLGTQATAAGHAVRADRTITAGTGLSGGGSLTADRTISADTTYLQRRVSGICADDQAIRVVNADGTVSCVAVGGDALPLGALGQTLRHDGSNWVANSLLFHDTLNNRIGINTALPGYTLDVSGTGRFTGALTLGTQATAAGHAVRADRTITAGVGLSGGGNLTANRTISADTAYLQRRVSGTCADDQAIRVVNADGTVSCVAVGGGTVTGTGVATRVAFWSGASSLSSNANLYWDDTNSRLGIGTTDPAGHRLRVAGRVFVDDGVIQRGGAAIGATSDLGLYQLTPGNWMRFVTNQGNIRFYTDGNVNPIGSIASLTINSNGNVGIGTESPNERLEVSGNVRLLGNLWFRDAHRYIGTQTNHHLYFRTNNADRMWINSAGHIRLHNLVGIGRDPSTYRLFLLGTGNQWSTRLQSGGDYDSNVYLAHGSGYGMHINTGRVDDSGVYIAEFRNASGRAMYIRGDRHIWMYRNLYMPGGDIWMSGGTRYIGTTDGNQLRIRTNNTDRITVLADGRVGIGTTNPNNLIQVANLINFNNDRVSTFLGHEAGRAITTGNHNTFVGHSAGFSNSTGWNNSFFGRDAGRANAGSGANSFFGSVAGMSNTGANNSFFGYAAGANNTAGTENSYFGHGAGLGSTGSYNSFFGSWIAVPANSGSNNSFFGYKAGQQLTSGNNNIFIGYEAGTGIQAGSNNVFIGLRGGVGDVSNTIILADGGGSERIRVNSQGRTGIGVTSPNYRLELPNTANNDGRGHANQWISASSIRWKTNIKPIENALDKVMKLRGVSYNWKDGGTDGIGLIAEEVGEIIPEVVSFEASGKDADGLSYGHLVGLLVEAIKEQQGRIEALEAKLICE